MEIPCPSHPQVLTALRCGRCEKPICPRCLVQTPVGARCRECAQLKKLPVFEVSPLLYARGIGAGIAIAVGGGIAWAFLEAAIPFFYISLLLAPALGYLIGQGISLAVNRKRSRGLLFLSGGCFFLSFLVASLFPGMPFLNLFSLIALALGIITAISPFRL